MMWLLAGIGAVGLALSGTFMSNVDEPEFTLIEKHDHIEIRQYAAVTVAQAEVSGEREKAINQGFRTVADYIFGNNEGQTKIAMTAPVTQQPSGENWHVRFIMPKNFSMDNLPKPNNAKVTLIPVPATRVAVIRFSGSASEDSLKERIRELQHYMREHHLKPASPPVMAFYNPPWTLPFLRRNEIMIEIAETK